LLIVNLRSPNKLQLSVAVTVMGLGALPPKWWCSAPPLWKKEKICMSRQFRLHQHQ